MRDAVRIVVGALVITGISAAVALTANSLRSEGALPLIAKRPYEILVPCPEERTAVEGLEPTDIPEEAVVFIDARPPEDFELGHVPEARSIPYDDLFDPPKDKLAALKNERAEMILVYGLMDGALNTGRLMAIDIAALGVARVRYLKGGVDAWASAGRPFEGELRSHTASEEVPK